MIKIIDNCCSPVYLDLLKKIASSSLKKHGLILKVKNDKQIIESINTISTEHLELLVKNYNKYSKKIINAGSIFNGKYSYWTAWSSSFQQIIKKTIRNKKWYTLPPNPISSTFSKNL